MALSAAPPALLDVAVAGLPSFPCRGPAWALDVLVLEAEVEVDPDEVAASAAADTLVISCAVTSPEAKLMWVNTSPFVPGPTTQRFSLSANRVAWSNVRRSSCAF